MAKKIISFLSMMQKDADKNDYTCMAGPVGMPVGEKVYGVQTNEAPVKALLLAHPDVSSIICIVTEETRNSNALKTFRDSILAYAKERNLKLTENSIVEVSYDNETQEFIQEPLKEILAHITAGGFNKDGDEILLDVTGGLRNIMMYLLLLSRILAYNNNRTIGAVYSVFYKKDPSKNRVVDCSELVRMFDLVGGMQELTSFGNVRTLRKYFGEQPEEECIRDLLDALEELNSAILLCRVSAIDSCMEKFYHALEATSKCNDPLMSKLIPAFKLLFRDKLKTKGLIRWCVNADMIQQALTLYVECIPKVIMDSVLKRNENTPLKEPQAYQDQNVAQFMDGFLRSVTNEHYLQKYNKYEYMNAQRKKYPNPMYTNQNTQKNQNPYAPYADQIATIEDMSHILPESGYERNKSFGIERIQTIARDYLYIKQLRNTVNHANDSGTENMNGLLEYLERHGYRKIEDVTVPYIKQKVSEALDHLAPPQEEKKRKK